MTEEVLCVWGEKKYCVWGGEEECREERDRRSIVCVCGRGVNGWIKMGEKLGRDRKMLEMEGLSKDRLDEDGRKKGEAKQKSDVSGGRE